MDWSLKEAAPERNWRKKARERIRHSDLVMVVAGTKTRSASVVRDEVAMAPEEGISVAQIIGYRKKKCPRVASDGRRYRWTYENLRKLLR